MAAALGEIVFYRNSYYPDVESPAIVTRVLDEDDAPCVDLTVFRANQDVTYATHVEPWAEYEMGTRGHVYRTAADPPPAKTAATAPPAPGPKRPAPLNDPARQGH